MISDTTKTRPADIRSGRRTTIRLDDPQWTRLKQLAAAAEIRLKIPINVYNVVQAALGVSIAVEPLDGKSKLIMKQLETETI